VTQSGDAQQLLEPFHAQTLTVSGSFTSMVGIVAGYTDGEDSAGVPDGRYVLGATPGVGFVPGLTFSARPDETIRFQGTVSFPFANGDLFAPTINEMFFDYTVRDLFYMRIGKHLVSWGVSRIFGAGGDLMAGSDAGLNLKVNVPIGSGGVTAIMLAPPSILASEFKWRDLTSGLQVNYPIGKSEIILSGTYFGNDDEMKPIRATAVLKTSLLGIDLFAEGVVGSSTLGIKPTISASPALSGVISGFFWERVDPEFKLYGEYYLNAADTSMKDQQISLVAGADNAFGSRINLGIQWTHAFLDNSGIVMPGFSFRFLPHLTMDVGLPVRYGAPGSFYLVNQSPTVNTSVIPTTVQSWYQRYGLLLRVNLNTSF